jgi:two-component system, cell cycle sensor histidine kinase and response regulator CckA
MVGHQHSRFRLSARAIALIYLLVSALWILLSDHAVWLITDDPNRLSDLQTVKGWGFIAFTAALLYALIRRHTRSLEASRDALQDSERRLEALLSNLTGMLYRCRNDRQWTMEFVSEGALAVTGYTAEAIKAGSPFYGDIIHPDDEGHVWKVVQEAVEAREPFELLYRIVTRTGDERWVREQGRGLFDAGGTLQAIEGFISDVTEHKLAVDRLADSEQRFRGLIENASDVITLLDHEGIISYQSPSVERMLGYAGDALVGTAALAYVHPDDRERVEAVFERALAHPGEAWPADFRIRDAAGAWHEVETTNQVFRAGAPESVIVCNMRDVSERKRAEAKSRRLEAQIRQQQKLEALGTLAGGIAHDFNNILSAILGYTETALMGLPEGARTVADDLQQVLKASHRARDLVRQILTFSRRTELGRAPVESKLILDEVLQLIQATFPSNIELVAEIAPEPAPVLVEPAQLHQVVLNICINAFQAMRTQGGRLSIAIGTVTLSEEADRLDLQLAPGEYVRITVRDTGHGMDPHTMEHMFEPFFTTKGENEGTGLGLSTAYGIVAEARGAIAVASAPGQGTTVEVYLPVHDEGSGGDTPAMSVTGKGRGELILVVDDEPAIAAMACKMLKRLGYETEAFSRAPDALAAFRADPAKYAAVFTDYSMPKLNGLELAREVRALQGAVPVILTSGFQEVLTARDTALLPVDEVIAKPFRYSDLAAAIERATRPAAPAR